MQKFWGVGRYDTADRAAIEFLVRRHETFESARDAAARLISNGAAGAFILECVLWAKPVGIEWTELGTPRAKNGGES